MFTSLSRICKYFIFLFEFAAHDSILMLNIVTNRDMITYHFFTHTHMSMFDVFDICTHNFVKCARISDRLYYFHF